MTTKLASEVDITRVRRESIRELILNQRVETQEHLREMLLERGFDVTQATLSRDLARLEARRVSLPEGGTTYELPGVPSVRPQGDLSSFREMIVSILEADSLIVIRTRTGTASHVALGIDESHFPEVAGTIAGDDTIFVAPSKGISPLKLKRTLELSYGLHQKHLSVNPKGLSKKTSIQKTK